MEKTFEQLLAKALRSRSTDIHFNITDDKLTVSMRTIRGIVTLERDSADLRLFNWLIYQAHLDPSATALPQSGSFTYYYSGSYYDFRFSTVSSFTGRNAVLRILNCHGGLKISELTVIEQDRNRLSEILKLKSGLVIFSGPTGQGKTTTLYSLLRQFRNKTVFSIEDPIEAVQENIVQLQVNEFIGFSYDEGIKQILRHNPDVLMIGEIRDEKTAQMTLRAALTGCLVFSSLHCASVTGALQRLLQLNLDRYQLANALALIVNQRLCRLSGKLRYSCIYDFLEKPQINDILLNNAQIEGSLEKKIEHLERNGVLENE
ncbi:MAG: Flp pilus assembly complex ATPase component TadA [Erysipelotrichaceae bacterium]|nr:Flp pilus assembly complex ATPase component TadA [Erysipelotrichaceae bacterium]